MAAPGAVASPPVVGCWPPESGTRLVSVAFSAAWGSMGDRGSTSERGVEPPIPTVGVAASRTTLIGTWVPVATAGFRAMTGSLTTTCLFVDAVFFVTRVDLAAGAFRRVGLLPSAAFLSLGVLLGSLFLGVGFFLPTSFFFGTGLFFADSFLLGAAFFFGPVLRLGAAFFLATALFTGAFKGSMQHEPDEEVSWGSDVARV